MYASISLSLFQYHCINLRINSYHLSYQSQPNKILQVYPKPSDDPNAFLSTKMVTDFKDVTFTVSVFTCAEGTNSNSEKAYVDGKLGVHHIHQTI